MVAGNAINAVEVKDTSSTKAAINSQGVVDTLDAFIDLVERNPDRVVRLRFLSTSQIAPERNADLRPYGETALDYWRRAAKGGEVAPLRRAILRAKIPVDLDVTRC